MFLSRAHYGVYAFLKEGMKGFLFSYSALLQVMSFRRYFEKKKRQILKIKFFLKFLATKGWAIAKKAIFGKFRF